VDNPAIEQDVVGCLRLLAFTAIDTTWPSTSQAIRRVAPGSGSAAFNSCSHFNLIQVIPLPDKGFGRICGKAAQSGQV